MIHENLAPFVLLLNTQASDVFLEKNDGPFPILF